MLKKWMIPILTAAGVLAYFALPPSAWRGWALVAAALSLLIWGMLNREPGLPPWKCPRCMTVLVLALALGTWGGIIVWAYAAVA